VVTADASQLPVLGQRLGTIRLGEARTGSTRTDPSAAMRNSTSSPGATFRWSRIGFGSVTCDFVVSA
jgi:hypothetical protein